MNKQDKIKKVMREFKDGKLKTPNGEVVTNKKQALAIAMSESEDYAEKADLIEDISIGSLSDAEDVIKGIGSEELFEKAVYADTAENRKLGRVGQEYHRGKGTKKEDKKTNLYGRRTKEQHLGQGAILVENGKHKYYRSFPYATKSEFLRELKSHLKKTGEKFDPSKLTSNKRVGYDHITRNEYTYTISGNREDEEKENFNYAMKRNEKTTPLYDKYRKQGLSSEEAQKKAFKELGYPEEG